MFSFLTFSVYGQSKNTDGPNLKGATSIDYYVTLKLVDKEPKFKPTYLFAYKLDLKQKKWNIDTNKINIDNYFLTNKNINHIKYSKPGCACNLFGDTTGNGVIIVYLKPSLKLLKVKNFIEKFVEASKTPFDPLKKYEIQINGKIITDDNVFIDSEAEIYRNYQITFTHRNGPLIGFSILTCSPEHFFKYGM